LTILLSAVLLAMGAGAAPAPRPAAKPIEKEKGWLEAKSVCLFRLGDGRMPQDPRELSVALHEGWKYAISLPDPEKAVLIEGGSYPTIDNLRIDFSQGRVATNGKKDKIELNDRVEKNLQVGHLEVRGTPMIVQQGQVNMRLVADTAQIDMERDRHGRPVMMIAQAKSGSLTFDVSQADAETIMLHSAREMASKYGVAIDRMKLTVTPMSPRSLTVSLYVATRVALVPAGMLFHARVDVDDKMNAHISGLTCDGDEALGPLIVHFLRPSLAKYNGKTRPLVTFPTDKMKLHDVAVHVDDGLHLSAAFGS
jgi:hypothetical protein